MIHQSHSGSILSRNIAIGDKTEIGANVEIHCSVFGSNVKIGHNVKIDGAYIWDNVVIEDNCTIKTSIIGKNVHLKAFTNLNSGCLIADNVIIGPNVTLKEATYVGSKPKDEDADLTVDIKSLGSEAKGYIWTENSGEDGQDDSDNESFSPEIWGIPLDESEQEISSTSSSENEASDSDDDFGGGDGDDAKRKFKCKQIASNQTNCDHNYIHTISIITLNNSYCL